MGFFANLKKRGGLGGALFLYGLLRVAPFLLAIAAILFAVAKVLVADIEPISARLPGWVSLVALFFGGIVLSIVGVLFEVHVNELAEGEAAKTGKAENQPPAEQGGAKPPVVDGNNNPACVRQGCPRSGKIPSNPLCSECHSDWQKQTPLRCAKCGYKYTNRPLCKLCYRKWRDENATADSAAAFADDFRKKHRATIRAEGGYYVRSMSEAMIGNYLHSHNIRHTYERKVPVKENLFCDFFLPDKKVYIEYWGLESAPEYRRSKEYRAAVYKKHNLNLIGLHKNQVQNLDDHMPRLLLQFGISVD